MVFHKQSVKDILIHPWLHLPGNFLFYFDHIRFLPIKFIIFFIFLSGLTIHITAQTNSEKSDSNTKDEYYQIYEKARFYQNRADSTLKIIKILRDELSSEAKIDDKTLLEKRILNLEQQQAEYQKKANQYLKKARVLKNNIDLTDQQERLAEISVYSDAFYKLPAISTLLTADEWQALYSLEPFYSEGNELMQDITKFKNEKNQLVILTNTSQNHGENEKIKNQIKDLDLKIRNNENKAFLNFQKVYVGKYKINSGIINRIALDTEQESQKIILNYKNNAAQNYKRSFELLKEAESTTSKEKQFDLLGESNTYALLAVETQKKAIGTYSGTFTGLYSASSGIPSNIDKKPDELLVHDKKQGISVDTMEHINMFTITTPENSDNSNIPIDKPMPPGIIYKIQIGVYQKTPSKTFFKGIRPLTAETIPSSQNLRFLAGMFSSYEDALFAVDTVHDLGFKDAFIVSYQDQKKIPVKEARRLKNSKLSQKKTPPVIKTTVSIANKQPIDLHKNVFLTVQIGVFYYKIPKERINHISLYAGNEPIKYFRNKKDLYVYTIGKFYNFEKAVTFKNKLIENGLEGAYIVAFSENQKIPLNEAIQLLSKKY